MLAAIYAAAAPIDAPKRLYLDGRYDEALPELQALHKKSPRDGNVAYYLGATLFALGRSDEAKAPLAVAQTRGVGDASRMLAEIALDAYDTDEASEQLDKWEAALRKNRKATIPESLDDMRSRVVAMSNMMERVESIEIIDSLTVDAAEFFRHYSLSPGAGRLTDGRNAGVGDAEAVFVPQCGREIFWSTNPDSTGMRTLMSAAILDDGTTENAAQLEIDMEAESRAFPFLMPDGATLYFAAEGPESLGGYDIFMTRRTDDGSYLQPQNIGMPYNSPANDYMLAIDEEAGMGWWATDRNAPEGKLTIYRFLPSAMRVNVEPDAPDLSDRARVTSIAATQIEGKDYDALRRKAAQLTRSAQVARDGSPAVFAVAMADGSVRHTLDEFRSPEARRAMEDLLGIDDEISAISTDLAALRAKYSDGSTSVDSRIRGLESELDKARKRRKTALNKVIRLESRI